MPEFILAPVVEHELWAIWQFIARDNPDAATRVIEAAYETFAKLAANPGLGRKKIPKLASFWRPFFPHHRFENYLIFYHSIANGIQVLHVYHGARDLESLFGES